jgi:thymidylate synthase ThyX
MISIAVTQDTTQDPRKKAALLARYSRDGRGYPAILEQYKDTPPDGILKFIDYGHTSIGALTGGITFCLDGISLLLAAKIFEIATFGDGQECSTRYIKMTEESLLPPEELGLDAVPQQFKEVQREAMALYHEVYDYLSYTLSKNPQLANIPPGTPPAMAKRLLNNYALDRARYFLPLTLKTNMCFTATGKIWAEIIKEMKCFVFKEAVQVAATLEEQLRAVVPEFSKYLEPSTADFNAVGQMLDEADVAYPNAFRVNSNCPTHVEVWSPRTPLSDPSLYSAMCSRKTRYDMCGTESKLQQVAVTWDTMAIAEVRDLQRHRNGTRFCLWAPKGFYLPPDVMSFFSTPSRADRLKAFLAKCEDLHLILRTSGPSHYSPYGLLLGSQATYFHSQPLNRFAYMAELRTGPGAHFRYAQHMREAVNKYYAVTGADIKILVGDASPEPI